MILTYTQAAALSAGLAALAVLLCAVLLWHVLCLRRELVQTNTALAELRRGQQRDSVSGLATLGQELRSGFAALDQARADLTQVAEAITAQSVPIFGEAIDDEGEQR